MPANRSTPPRPPFSKSSFDARGGLGKMYQLFGENLDAVIEEANRELTA
jgi:type I restriction enzyme R subunit